MLAYLEQNRKQYNNVKHYRNGHNTNTNTNAVFTTKYKNTKDAKDQSL